MDVNEIGIRAGLEDLPEHAIRRWFVMRDFKRPNAKYPAYKQLADAGIRVYTPLRERLVTRNERKVRETVPVIYDLLFVYSNLQTLTPIVEHTPTLQYRYVKGHQQMPMVVSDRDMNNFIQAGERLTTTQYIAADEITPEMLSRQVRIIGGPFDQCVGHLLSTRGTKRKRLILGIPNIVYKSIEIFDYDYIEYLP